MTITTLERIHKTLIAEVSRATERRDELALKIRDTYDNETNSYDPDIEKQYRDARYAVIEMSSALQDFEKQEW